MANLDPAAAVYAIEAAGFTHVVWIPDSYVGPWESGLANSPRLRLIRPCREGEAIAIAAGLTLGGSRPLVVMQCTGLFEAGDALRNVVHDLKLPLKMIVGVRSQQAFEAGKSNDNCPVFTAPIMQAWRVPIEMLSPPTAESFEKALKTMINLQGASAILLGE